MGLKNGGGHIKGGCMGAASNLTLKVIDHQRTGSGFADLMRDIVEEVLNNRETYGFGDREEACDVLAQYYPRLSSLVRRFSGDSRSFEPYLFSSLRFFRKSLECRQREEDVRAREIQTREARIEQGLEVDSDGSFVEAIPDFDRIVKTLTLQPRNGASLSSSRKRILFLGMKCAFSLSDRHIIAIAELSGMPEEHLRARLSFLRTMAEPRIARREYLGRLRDKLFASLCFYERKLHDELDEFKRERYQSMAARYRARLAKCRERLESVRLDPTNTEIALVCGVPKGTVDSGIFCFKHFNAPKAE
jgi:hypothetical protein